MNGSWPPEKILVNHSDFEVKCNQERNSAKLFRHPVRATLSEKTAFQPRCSSAVSLYNPVEESSGPAMFPSTLG
jgi:hypothetical protein